MHILLIDTTHPILEKLLKADGHELTRAYRWHPQKVLDEIHEYEGLVVRSRMPIDRPFFERASALKCIGRFGSGMENIDLEAAKEHGVRCFNAPEGNRQAVAEHSLGMLLALMNRLRNADREVRSGIWHRRENTGTELSGKTVGILGYGHMGSAFGDVLRGFDVRVLAYDKYRSDWTKNHVERVDLATLQRESDVLSMHIPLTDETRHMVDAAFLESFAKPIWLINTSRGPILDTAALLDQIRNNRVLGAGLDVHEFESASFISDLSAIIPQSVYGRLLASDRVLLTPHVAGWTHEGFEKMARVLAGRFAASVETDDGRRKTEDGI